MIKLILSDFSKEPFGRYESDGPYSGEVYRKKILLPAIKKSIDINQKVTVIIDSNNLNIDLGSSFLEEAFGGLIRIDQYKKSILEDILTFESDDDYDLNRALKYINDETNRNIKI